jgi:hypothetical protein
MGQIGFAGETDLPLMNGCGKNVCLFDHPEFGWGEIRLNLIEDVVDTKHEIPKC